MVPDSVTDMLRDSGICQPRRCKKYICELPSAPHWVLHLSNLLKIKITLLEFRLGLRLDP